MLVTEKRDKSVKARCVYDGSKTRAYFDREETASPTVSQEAIFLTAVIDAKENRDVMTADIPNAFIQADLDPSKTNRTKQMYVLLHLRNQYVTPANVPMMAMGKNV